MQKLLAIILLFSFTVSQYARQLAYMECRLNNYLNSSLTDCNCEKVWTQSTTPDESPLPDSQRHLHPEEWYTLVRGDLNEKLLPENIPSHNSILNFILYPGYGSLPERPPGGSKHIHVC
ncbi:MAG TPA: hypothetical protein VFX58_01875 [Chitinophagaceae bacterium]|nr:hypothetical protein [Chitinophagaceae bacterium]